MTSSLPTEELNFNPSRVQRFTTLSIMGEIYYDGPTEIGHGLSSSLCERDFRSKQPFSAPCRANHTILSRDADRWTLRNINAIRVEIMNPGNTTVALQPQKLYFWTESAKGATTAPHDPTHSKMSPIKHRIFLLCGYTIWWLVSSIWSVFR